MLKIVIMILSFFVYLGADEAQNANAANVSNSAVANVQKPQWVANQAPLIVEFAVFQEAQKQCGGSDYTKLPCLVEILKNYSNRIYTKQSGSIGQFSVIFYGINDKAEITYPKNIHSKYCEFVDTMGKKSISKLTGNGFNYILNYKFANSSSSSKAYISCHFMQGKQIISQITQPISVIPKDFDISLSLTSNQGVPYFLTITNNLSNQNPSVGELDSTTPQEPNEGSLNIQDPASPNYSSTQAVDYESFDLTLKAQTYPISVNANATARTLQGNIDSGFSSNIIPYFIKFTRDNGLCSPIGESINGEISFKNGKITSSTLNLNFLDVASGELEIVLGHTLDKDDRDNGKCLITPPNPNEPLDIANVGKIPCYTPIVIKKRVEILPYNFYAKIHNSGRQIYYNQHTLIRAIPFLPTTQISLQALNDRNQILKNFTNSCYAKDLAIGLDDFKNELVFVDENLPSNLLQKENFTQNSQANFIRKLSATGIKDRSLTPADAFNSGLLNLNNTKLKIGFYNKSEKYPVYFVSPKISNDWHIALLRGRISLVPNENESTSLIANPKIYYEILCKSPTCKTIDLESVLSPRTRFAQSPRTNHWFVNTAHPFNFKVESENLALGEGLSVYSLGSVENGVQTLAIKSATQGVFDIKIRQDDGESDFATFLYFAPNYINVRENLGVETKVRF